MIKRIRAALLALCMALSLAHVPALAQVTIGKCGRNVYYSYDSSTKALTITGTGDMASYEISLPAPWKSFREEIENVSIASSVTSIGSYAFYSCRGLTSVTIPDGVTSIGESAFNECYNLEHITIPDSVTSIGDKAFYLTAYYVEVTNRENGVLYIGYHLIKAFDISGEYEIKSGTKTVAEAALNWCNGLTGITIPDSVTDIGDDAFSNCEGLTSVTIPNSVKSIGNGAFDNCTGLTSVTIPGSVTSIGDSAFNYCTDLTTVTIPDGVTNIGGEAFKYCYKLEQITIPDSVTSIGKQAFDATAYYYKGYDDDTEEDSNWENGALYIGNHLIRAFVSGEYEIKANTKTIAGFAFNGCENMTSVTIPDSVVSIGDNAFEYCTGLAAITIPDSVISVGNNAFRSCHGLTSITIPKNVTSIGEYTFWDCLRLAEIKVAAENNAYCSENGVLYDKEKTEIICFPKEKRDTVFEIPNSVTSIAAGTFADCLNLTSITIPDAVSGIGDYAFYECSGLERIIIPDGVPSLGLKAFYGCSSLESVTIPNSVISIGEQAFLECGNFKTVNYIGTDVEWNKIIKGTKCSIDGKKMNYCKGISAIHADGRAVVRPVNIDSGKTVILAIYSGDKLVGIQSKIYDGAEVMFETNEACTELRAMVWEDIVSMTPVCGNKIIK